MRRLSERHVAILLAGARAAPNLGADYAREFEAIYPDLATANDLLLYPFFLDGVAAVSQLNQRDGVHPSAAGIDAIVARILPKVEELVARVQAQARLTTAGHSRHSQEQAVIVQVDLGRRRL